MLSKFTSFDPSTTFRPPSKFSMYLAQPMAFIRLLRKTMEGVGDGWMVVTLLGCNKSRAEGIVDGCVYWECY